MHENKLNNIPYVSIVIPCFNDAEYIEQCVISALSQTYSNKEIIIVDDGSNLETKTILKRLEPKITKLLTQENQGQSTARNLGVKAASGEYILVLDSDDYFEPSFCEKAVLKLKDTNIKIVASHIVRRIGEKKIDELHHKGGDLSVLILYNQATGSVMFRKEDFNGIGGYDQSMRRGFEDWEFYIRLLQNGGLIYIIKEPLFNYRVRTDSTTSKANSIKYELLNYIYTKHSNLVIAHFGVFVEDMLSRIEREEIEKIKNTQRIEFEVGKLILKPFRWVKSLVR